MADLGELFRAAREARRLTQADLAKRVGVTLRTIGNWERGQPIPPGRIPHLEAALGVRARPDGHGGYRLTTQAVPDQVAEPGAEGGAVTIFVNPEILATHSAAEIEYAVAAGRAAILAAILDIDRRRPPE